MSEVLPSMEELLKRAEAKGRADAIDLISRHLWNYDHKVYNDFENVLEQIKEQTDDRE